jgi:predicted  nucleic acid-binding Zn-ribbon protein
MEVRVGQCEKALEKANNEIEQLYDDLQHLTIEKTDLEGSLKRICDKIDNLDGKIKRVQDDFDTYRKDNKEDFVSLKNEIQQLHSCLVTEKLSNQKNSVIIATVIPIIMLAIAFFLGIK